MSSIQDKNDPVESFSYASSPYESKNYEVAINRLSQFRARFPYAKDIAKVELMIADAHFGLEQYDEAAFEYAQFSKLRPNHPKVAYSMYQLGQCYWKDAPEEVDREQAFTYKAMQQWQRLIRKFPNTEYSKKSAEQIKLGKRRIADHMEFIGNFYCKMEIYHACANRFINLVKRFPDYPDLAKVANQNAVIALEKMLTEKKAKNLKQDANLFFKNMSDDQIRAMIKSIKSKL